MQYNDRDEILASNQRFGWLSAAKAGLFVEYNEGEDLEDGGLGRRDRALTVRYSRIIDLLR